VNPDPETDELLAELDEFRTTYDTSRPFPPDEYPDWVRHNVRRITRRTQ
jgi:hypothetical protein